MFPVSVCYESALGMNENEDEMMEHDFCIHVQLAHEYDADEDDDLEMEWNHL